MDFGKIIMSQEVDFSQGRDRLLIALSPGMLHRLSCPNQKLQSILMNIGYKLQHYEHIREEKGEHKEEQAKMGTAKYGQRIGHEAVWQQEGNELQDVAVVKELLTYEKRLVALKKGTLTEQREKVAVAQQIEPPPLAMDKFVAIAIEIITPYLIAHYHQTSR